MEIIHWKGEMSVGIDAIDNQHKHLVDLINQLYQSMTEGKSKEVMDSVLNELVNYGATHFKTEEEMFQKYKYPNTHSHTEEHKAFLNTVGDLMEKYNRGEYKVSMDTLHFLRDWITHHIMESDMAYGPYLQEKLNAVKM